MHPIRTRAAVTTLCLLGAASPVLAANDPIRPDNVNRLALAWTYDTGDSTAALMPGEDGPAFEATPVYVDGQLYLSTPMGTVAALDAETGRELWKVDLKIRRNTDYSDFANRGPTVHGDRIYVGTVDARLACLERRTGQFCSRFGQGGQIDLTQGLRRPPKRPGEYGVTSAPAVFRDLVIVGSNVADNSRARNAVGRGARLRCNYGSATLDVPSAARRCTRGRSKYLDAHRSG